MRAKMLAAVAVASAVFIPLVPPAADAHIGRLRTDYKQGEVITAYSRFGNGAIKSIVRRAPRYGWQVRLPRGGWVDCRRSCEETLRVQTVDFFGSDDNSISSGGYGTLQRECGIFGCLGGSYEFSF
ncbi:hypothetical protein [Hyphomicrobium sp.]|uniref:hypothetical protein n=1 Tax=Hyphomicrobium sp. TaxID=82 RepID=UPI002D79F5B2|nr:hypothetical protein [Hyphomicrobium sp.]HET6390106.1 hypothetical protein [Hyphomicrobium sp.]